MQITSENFSKGVVLNGLSTFYKASQSGVEECRLLHNDDGTLAGFAVGGYLSPPDQWVRTLQSSLTAMVQNTTQFMRKLYRRTGTALYAIYTDLMRRALVLVLFFTEIL